MNTTHTANTVGRRLYPISGNAPTVTDVLPISRSTVYNLIADGELERVNIGARSFVTAESLDRYIDRLRDEQRPDRNPTNRRGRPRKNPSPDQLETTGGTA